MKRILLLILTLSYTTLLANGIQLRNLVVNQGAQTVTFDIRWFNAWRFNVSEPLNWDAAWVFVKFKACDDHFWTHGQLSTNVADHIFPPELEPVLADGSATGIEPAPDNLGVLLRISEAVKDTMVDTLGWYTVTLKVTNMPTSGAINVKVFAIEMVFIPEGQYQLGALGGHFANNQQGAYSFSPNCDFNLSIRTPYDITSEAAMNIKWAGNCTGVNLPADFPKGFAAFHVMKYEISQGQYADYLNTLPPVSASLRYPGNYNQSRNRLANSGTAPNTYFSDRPDRAQNYLSAEDIMGYLDWAALRPMSEMEYEKICRGKDLSVDDQYPWGLPSNLVAGTVFNKSPEDGTELFIDTDANCTFNNVTYVSGDGGQGPARVGIHVEPNLNDRVKSGVTYYGVPDMGGNVWEFVVTVRNTGFTRAWGDGVTDNEGRHNQAGWPPNNSNCSRYGWRGGGWDSDWRWIRISNRQNSNGNCKNSWDRGQSTGGRGVR